MRLLDRLFGTAAPGDGSARAQPPPDQPDQPDQQAYALERYRYMLRTAPPEAIEQAHAEAFARLAPEQRAQVLAELARSAPETERAALQRVSSEDAQALARAATRAEVRQPGIMERTLGAHRGAGFGAGLLGSFAAGFAGSLVATSFFSALGGGFDGAGEVGAGEDGSGALDGTTDFDGADVDF